MVLRKAASSSGTKPCTCQTVAVVAAALATYGRAKPQIAARPTVPASADRRLMVPMAVALPVGQTLQRRLFIMAFAQALVVDFTLQRHVERGQTLVAPSTALRSIS